MVVFHRKLKARAQPCWEAGSEELMGKDHPLRVGTCGMSTEKMKQETVKSSGITLMKIAGSIVVILNALGGIGRGVGIGLGTVHLGRVAGDAGGDARRGRVVHPSKGNIFLVLLQLGFYTQLFWPE